ncbi:MAG: hypothetical protein ACRC14_17965 [Paracoccaceae bacterium]
MRLILSGDAVYLAADGRLILVDGPERLALLMEWVLVTTAPPGTTARLPVETLQALRRTGTNLMAETAGPRSSEPISIPMQEAPLLVTLLEGHYRDRWTAETFAVDLVNTTSEPCEVILYLYLPELDDEHEEAKRIMVQTDVNSFEIEVHRGGPTPISLPVDTTLSAAFRTTPEPSQDADARSLGVLVAAVRGSSGQVADLFHLSTYFS